MPLYPAGRGTGGSGPRSAGNLVLNSETGVPLWSTGTVGYPGSYLAIQNDGNLVVYDVTGQARWASNTCCR